MNASLSPQQVRVLRMQSQRLVPAGGDGPDTPAGEALAITPAGVARAVGGLQAQDLPAARLSIHARGAEITLEAVERARQEERTLAWTWLMRGTLHLVAAEDALWLLPLLGPARVAADRWRMRQLGWDDESALAGLRVLTESLAKNGAMTRAEIVAALAGNGLPQDGQAPIHLLGRAALEGLIIAGPNRGKQRTFVLLEEWLGPLRPLPREEALARLALRHLEAFAPARAEDLAAWSGIKMGEARLAWQLIADQVVTVEMDGRTGGMLESQLARLEQPAPPGPLVQLLPAYDTFLLGYTSRDLLVDPVYFQKINAGGGVIHPVVLVDGRALAGWKIQRARGGLEIWVEPFEPLPVELLPLVETQAAGVGAFLGQEAVLKISPPLNG